MDSTSLLRVYCALIRPVLTYGFQCFCNAPLFLLKNLTRIEKRVLRMICVYDGGHTDIIAFANRLCNSLFEKVERTEDHPLRLMFEDRLPTAFSEDPSQEPRGLATLLLKAADDFSLSILF